MKEKDTNLGRKKERKEKYIRGEQKRRQKERKEEQMKGEVRTRWNTRKKKMNNLGEKGRQEGQKKGTWK